MADDRETQEERDRWVRLDRLLGALASEIASVRRREISLADRISQKITEAGSQWLGDRDFVAAMQDFDLMSQELDHVSSLLAAISDSLQHREAVEVAVVHGIDAVKLSSMRRRLMDAVYGGAAAADNDESEDEIW
jgi:hypothetical protein